MDKFIRQKFTITIFVVLLGIADFIFDYSRLRSYDIHNLSTLHTGGRYNLPPFTGGILLVLLGIANLLVPTRHTDKKKTVKSKSILKSVLIYLILTPLAIILALLSLYLSIYVINLLNGK